MIFMTDLTASPSQMALGGHTGRAGDVHTVARIEFVLDPVLSWLYGPVSLELYLLVDLFLVCKKPNATI